jgi:hypothetical protein
MQKLQFPEEEIIITDLRYANANSNHSTWKRCGTGERERERERERETERDRERANFAVTAVSCPARGATYGPRSGYMPSGT